MASISREIWGYAVLLIILFSIAALAVWQTISFFQSPDDLTFPVVMWSLTMGFMLIAGAYGLWAMKFSAQAESRRRIGRFVDAMDYFPDGLIVLDKNGDLVAESAIRVRGNGSVLLVQRGMERESYSCAPQCVPSIQLGDGKMFESTAAQITARNNLATPGAAR